LRQILESYQVSFERTKTWKESGDPDKEAKLDRIEEVITNHLDRTFAFDEFGPLAIHPIGGYCWATRNKPHRLRANAHEHCGTSAVAPSTVGSVVPRLLLGRRRPDVGGGAPT